MDAGFRTFLRGAPPSLVAAFRGVPLDPETRYTVVVRVRKEGPGGSEVRHNSGGGDSYQWLCGLENATLY